MNKLRIALPTVLGIIVSLIGLTLCSSDILDFVTINNLGLNNYLIIFYIVVFVALFLGFNWNVFTRTINTSQFKFGVLAAFVSGLFTWVVSFWEVSRTIFFIGPYTVAKFFLGFTELYHVAPELTELLTPFIVIPTVYGVFAFLTKYLYDLTNRFRPIVRIIISSLPFLLIVLITFFIFVSMILGGGH